jgi:hypothetical protein
MRLGIRSSFHLVGILGLALASACSVGAQQNNSNTQSQGDDRAVERSLAGIERRMDQQFNQLQVQIQTQNQNFANTAYHHLIIATAFMAMATLFVVGITIFTGLNINASRTDFRDHLARLGNDFREKLTDQTNRSQEELARFRSEVAELEKENRERTSELTASTVSLNDFKDSIQREFTAMKAEFDVMRAGHQPAKEIKEEVVEEMRAEFEKPQLLRHETMRQIILLLLDNPTINEKYKERLEHELERLDDRTSRPSGD